MNLYTELFNEMWRFGSVRREHEARCLCFFLLSHYIFVIFLLLSAQLFWSRTVITPQNWSFYYKGHPFLVPSQMTVTLCVPQVKVPQKTMTVVHFIPLNFSFTWRRICLNNLKGIQAFVLSLPILMTVYKPSPGSSEQQSFTGTEKMESWPSVLITQTQLYWL